MFRDRLLMVSFFISLLINTGAVCMIGGVIQRPLPLFAEEAKKNTLRPVRIGSYKPPKASQARPTPATEKRTEKRSANKNNKAQAKTASRPVTRKAPEVRLAKRDQAKLRAAKAAGLSQRQLESLRAAMAAKAAQEAAKQNKGGENSPAKWQKPAALPARARVKAQIKVLKAPAKEQAAF